jgi:hypothetical protein
MLKQAVFSLAGVVAVGFAGSAKAATFTVSNFDDAGIGSLRQAIEDANNQAGADIINFDSDLGSGIINLLTGQLNITDSVTINGPGADQVTVDAGGLSRVFLVDDFDTSNIIDVFISDLRISGGKASGGNFIGDGAGIFNRENLTVTKSAITKNESTNVSGGIFNSGSLLLADSKVSNNIGPFGGGFRNVEGSAKVVNSTISGNTSTRFGAGIDNVRATLELINTTITGNISEERSGGIGVSGGIVTIKSSTIVNNSATDGSGIRIGAGEVTVANSIIAKNVGDDDISGSFTSLGFNLIGNGDGGTGFTDGVNGDQVGGSNSPIDPKLGPLQDNGGPTETQALLPGSPAIDAANPDNFPDTDQRGVARPQGSAPDIGAFELRESVPEPASLLGLAAISAVAVGGALKKKAAA